MIAYFTDRRGYPRTSPLFLLFSWSADIIPPTTGTMAEIYVFRTCFLYVCLYVCKCVCMSVVHTPPFIVRRGVWIKYESRYIYIYRFWLGLDGFALSSFWGGGARMMPSQRVFLDWFWFCFWFDAVVEFWDPPTVCVYARWKSRITGGKKVTTAELRCFFGGIGGVVTTAVGVLGRVGGYTGMGFTNYTCVHKMTEAHIVVVVQETQKQRPLRRCQLHGILTRRFSNTTYILYCFRVSLCVCVTGTHLFVCVHPTNGPGRITAFLSSLHQF